MLISYVQTKWSLLTKQLNANPQNCQLVTMVQTDTHSETGSPQRCITLQIKQEGV